MRWFTDEDPEDSGELGGSLAKLIAQDEVDQFPDDAANRYALLPTSFEPLISMSCSYLAGRVCVPTRTQSDALSSRQFGDDRS